MEAISYSCYFDISFLFTANHFLCFFSTCFGYRFATIFLLLNLDFLFLILVSGIFSVSLNGWKFWVFLLFDVSVWQQVIFLYLNHDRNMNIEFFDNPQATFIFRGRLVSYSCNWWVNNKISLWKKRRFDSAVQLLFASLTLNCRYL